VSFARFSEDSDVYVYLGIDGTFQCCGCWLSGTSVRLDSTDDMISHLRRHQVAGHSVPGYALERLEAEREENDEFIKNAGRS
jgi:hypothetical protein